MYCTSQRGVSSIACDASALNWRNSHRWAISHCQATKRVKPLSSE